MITAAGAASHAGTVVEISAGGPDTGHRGHRRRRQRGAVAGLQDRTGYTATYRRPGYTTPLPALFAVTSSATTAVPSTDLQVSRTASITGVATVLRPAGAAASAGILVSLTGTDLNGASVTGSTSTVSGGSYALPALPQGTYSLTFSRMYYDSQTRSGVAVMDGATVTAPPAALPVSTGTIAGQLVLSRGSAASFVQGTDHSGAVVTLTGLEAGVEVPVAVTDASGNFRFEGVPVHTSHAAYGVVAQRSNYSSGSGSVTAEPAATAAVVPSPMTLQVNVGSVTGTVAVNDDGSPATPPGGSVTVSLTGTAFNSTAFSASASNVGSSFSLPDLPAGTYDVVASSSGRACSGAAAITVEAGQALALPTPFVCTDAVVPGSVALGVPQGAGAQPGFTSSTAVDVPIVTHAVDVTGNLRGYQYAAGGVPAWAGAPITEGLVNPVPYPANTLTSDGPWTLWVRAVDRVGNAGPASSVQVTRDTQRPAGVAINTARTVVNDTSTTAIITGGNDANFQTYQSCTAFVAPTAACPSPCTPTDTAPSIAITFDAANRKACVWAGALDQAGNPSASLTGIELVSDLIPPTGPSFAPLYDPATVTVHADYVDFRITAAAADLPGVGTPWQNIAWVEADTGGGFTPICPQAACRAAGYYAPCGCACSDSRLVCNGTTFSAIRMPLNGGTANTIAVRAVDVAGNVGSGASQQVQTSGVLSAVATSVADEKAPRVRGRTLVYSSSGTATVVDLGRQPALGLLRRDL